MGKHAPIMPLAAAVAAAFLWTGPVGAADFGRTPTVTRLVRVFSGLESRLIEAVGKHDRQTLAELLTADFEMRVGARPGEPVPRAAWMRQSFAAPEETVGIEQMAVHDFGATAVASFLWKTRVAGPEKGIFVVDVWRRETKGWQLAVRYADAAMPGGPAVPGASSAPPPFEKKE